MKSFIFTTIIFSTLISLTGCGGGGGSATEYLAGIAVSCNSSSVEDGTTITIKAGSAGSIDLDCNADDDAFFLKSPAESLEVKKVVRTIDLEVKCDGGNTASLKGILNYETGVYDITGNKANGDPVSCQITYNPAPFPITFTTKQSITQLLTDYASDTNQPLTNTCPIDTPTNANDSFDCNTLTGDYDMLYEITDSADEMHTIAIHLNVK